MVPTLGWAQTPAPALPDTLPARDAELVIVTGIRRSLELAVDLKRARDQISDVITAEDVAKLPDANVAEALQRVTGVQITRVFGEGQSVSIRGLQQVRVEVNGRTLLGFSARVSPPEYDNLGRSSGLDSVASSLFGKLSVYKSPLPSQGEGGLGGTVNLETPKPFGFALPTMLLRAQTTYSSGADILEPGATAVFTTRFGDQRFGILLAADYQKRSSNLQLFERNNFFNRLNGGSTPILAPALLQYENTDIDRSRLGVNGTVQVHVTPNFVLTADALYAHQRADRTNTFIAFNLPTSPTGVVVSNPVLDDKGFVIAGTALGTIRTGSQIREDPATSIMFGLNGLYDNRKLSLEGDIYVSQARLRQKIEIITLQTANEAVRGTFDYRGGVVPSLTLATLSGARFDATSYSNFPVAPQGTLTFRANATPASLKEVAGRFDIGYRLGEGVKVHAGIRYVELTATFEAFRSRATATQTDLLPNLTFGNANFLNRISGDFPRLFVTATPNSSDVIRRVLIGEPSLTPTDPQGSLRRNAARDFDLRETTHSGYFMLEAQPRIFGRLSKLNVGARVSHTDFVVNTFALTGTTLLARTDANSYTNVLPSANLVVPVTDTFVLRVAVSETMQRAGLAELAPSTFIEPTNRTASGGNAQLKPPVSSNFDMSLEYYASKASLISGAIFVKHVKDFIATTTSEQIFEGFENLGLVRATRPDNVDSANVKGFEIGIQHFFDTLPAPFDGLGIIANYTFSDSRASNGFPLVAASKHSFNVVGLYEKGRFSARIAYNWRDDAVFEFTQGRPDVIAARSQLDGQFGIDLTDAIALSFQAQNVMPEDAATVEISDFNPLAINSYALSETRYSIGIRAKF